MIGAIRPDDWNLPLLLHVVGASALVGFLVCAATAFVLGWQRDVAAMTRLGFRSLLFGALPSYVAMRAGADWLYQEVGFGDGDDPDWISIGYATADLGALLLVVTLVVTGIAARRARGGVERRSVAARVGAVLAFVAVGAYLVALWAMTVKPG